MKTLYSLLVLLYVTLAGFAQNPKYRVISIPVERSGIDLREPWVGGVNSPQFSPINLNNDNLADLFVYDKTGDKVLTYINNGTGGNNTYTYAPQYEHLFPQELFSWALIRDYNNDNIPDIFTRANSGIMVYKGTYHNNQLQFNVVSNLLMFPFGNNMVNIWNYLDDIPVVADVNKDGDLDLIIYPLGFFTPEYYENQTMEHGGNPAYDFDSLKYERYDACWGKFMQSSLNNSFTFNITCPALPEPGPAEQRHVGNTIYGVDYGNDNDLDLLNGNIGYNNLSLLENCGDTSYAFMCFWDSLFPACNRTVAMDSYPAAFGADVNLDGLEDILVSPNLRIPGGRDVKNVMLYLNSTDTLCQFKYESDSFLVQHQLDFGTDSKPVFFDFNGDGLLDIVVGNYGYFRPFQAYRSAVALFQNIGTSTHPEFRQVTDDYNNFSTIFNMIGKHPAFGDLDGDGKPDMVWGEEAGYVHFFKNTGSSGASFAAMTVPMLDTLDVGQYSAPFIYDLNGDSLNDLLVGRKDGKLSYFWNFGTTTAPQFHKDSANNDFGDINILLPPSIDGYSVPWIIKTNAGDLRLFVGSNQGKVFEYLIAPQNLRGGAFNLIDSDFLKTDVGTRAAMAVADINNDGLLEYLVGNSRGGLAMYSDSLWDTSTFVSIAPTETKPNTFKVYPNPSNGSFICELQTENNLHRPVVEVFNLLGELVGSETNITADKIFIELAAAAHGIYVVRMTYNGAVYYAKILVER